MASWSPVPHRGRSYEDILLEATPRTKILARKPALKLPSKLSILISARMELRTVHAHGSKDSPALRYGCVLSPLPFARLYSPASSRRSYHPSLTVALLGAVLFGAAALAHGWRLAKHRAWRFSPLLLGAVLDVAGYVFRALSLTLEPYRVSFFALQYCFLVSAPVCVSAALYTVACVLARRVARTAGGGGSGSSSSSSSIVKGAAPSTGALPARSLPWVFGSCDVLATAVQIFGVTMLAGARMHARDATVPTAVLLGGLAMQALSFLAFLVLHVARLCRAPRAVWKTVDKRFHAAFVVATLLVYLRTCFRLAEAAEALALAKQAAPSERDIGLSRHEVFFAGLEFAPVLIAVALLAVWHPGKHLSAAPLAPIVQVTRPPGQRMGDVEFHEIRFA